MQNLDISAIPPEHDQSGFVSYKPSEQASFASLSQAYASIQQDNSQNATQIRKQSPNTILAQQQFPIRKYSNGQLPLFPPASGNAQLPPNLPRDNSLNGKRSRQPIFGANGSNKNTSSTDLGGRKSSTDINYVSFQIPNQKQDIYALNDGQKQSSFIVNLGNTEEGSFLSSAEYRFSTSEYKSNQPFSVKHEEIKVQPIHSQDQVQSARFNSFDRETRTTRINTLNVENNSSIGDNNSIERSANKVGNTQNIKKRFQTSNSPLVSRKADLSKSIDNDALNKVNDALKNIEIQLPSIREEDKAIESKLNQIMIEATELANIAKNMKSSIKACLESKVQEVVQEKISKMEEDFNFKLKLNTENINQKINVAQLQSSDKGTQLIESQILAKNIRKELENKASKFDVESVVNQKSADLWNRLGGLKEEIKCLDKVIAKGFSSHEKIEGQIVLKDKQIDQTKQDLQKIMQLHDRLSQEVSYNSSNLSSKSEIVQQQFKTLEQRIRDLSNSKLLPSNGISNYGKLQEEESNLKELTRMFKEIEAHNAIKLQLFQKELTDKFKYQIDLLVEERKRTASERIRLEEERILLHEERAKLYSIIDTKKMIMFKIKKGMQLKVKREDTLNKLVNKEDTNNFIVAPSIQKQTEILSNHQTSLVNQKNSQRVLKYSEQLEIDEDSDKKEKPHPLLNDINYLEKQMGSPFLSPPSPQIDQLFRSSSNNNKNYFLSQQMVSQVQPLIKQHVQLQVKDSSILQKEQQQNSFIDPINFSAIDASFHNRSSNCSNHSNGGIATYENNDIGNKQTTIITEQSQYNSKAENPFLNACISSINQNQCFPSTFQQSQQVGSTKNIVYSKQNMIGDPYNSIQLYPEFIEIEKSKKIIGEIFNRSIKDSERKVEPSYSQSKSNFEGIQQSQIKEGQVFNSKLLKSKNHSASPNFDDIMDQFEDFNENNIQLVSQNEEEEDLYYEEELENQKDKYINEQKAEDLWKKASSTHASGRETALIQIAEEEENDEESNLGTLSHMQSPRLTQMNSIEQQSSSKEYQNRQKVISQIEGLLQSKGMKKLTCLRDEVGYIKDSKGFYIFDSEGRMIKSDQDTYNYLISQGTVEPI